MSEVIVTKVPAKDLVNLLAAVLPMASTDKFVPMLCAVRLEVRGNYLIATATDRYVAGMARTFISGDGDLTPWVGLVDGPDIKAIITEARKIKVGAALAELTVANGKLVFGAYGQEIRTARFVDDAYPRVELLFEKALAIQAGRTRPAGVNPDLVTKFSAIAKSTGQRCIDYWLDNKAETIAVTCGDDFIGIIMGIRLTHLAGGARTGRVGYGWDDLLDGRSVTPKPGPAPSGTRPIEDVPLPAPVAS